MKQLRAIFHFFLSYIGVISCFKVFTMSCKINANSRLPNTMSIKLIAKQAVEL